MASRTLMLEVGDWVAADFATGPKPGKVVAADHESAEIEFRFTSGTSRLRYDEDSTRWPRRIRWERGRGRSTWRYLA